MHKPHRGNKQQLPSKPCQTCGRPMAWRRAWARNWDAVRHCSAACRKRKHAAPSALATDTDAGPGAAR